MSVLRRCGSDTRRYSRKPPDMRIRQTIGLYRDKSQCTIQSPSSRTNTAQQEARKARDRRRVNCVMPNRLYAMRSGRGLFLGATADSCQCSMLILLRSAPRSLLVPTSNTSLVQPLLFSLLSLYEYDILHILIGLNYAHRRGASSPKARGGHGHMAGSGADRSHRCLLRPRHRLVFRNPAEATLLADHLARNLQQLAGLSLSFTGMFHASAVLFLNSLEMQKRHVASMRRIITRCVMDTSCHYDLLVACKSVLE